MSKIHDFKNNLLELLGNEEDKTKIKNKFENITFGEIALFLFMLWNKDEEQEKHILEMMEKYKIPNIENNKLIIKNHYKELNEIKNKLFK